MNALRARIRRYSDALWAQHLQTRSDAPLETRDAWLVVGLFVALAGIFYVNQYGGQSHTRKLGPVVGWFVDGDPSLWLKSFFYGRENQLRRYQYWTGSILVFYGLIPFVFARFALRLRWNDLGLSARGAAAHIKTYVALYLAILLPLLFASTLQSFQRTYPMLRAARLDTELLAYWEFSYLPQFIAVEFLFRGFFIFAYERRLGLFAVFLPLVPYAMIHIGKPPAEVFGALLAGLVLGVVAFRTRSIWLGVGIHMSVALSMDVLSHWHHLNAAG